MSDNQTPTPPGWYHDPDGMMRWWDGSAWTAVTVVAPATQQPAPTGLEAGAATAYAWRKLGDHAAFFLVSTLVLGLLSAVPFIGAYIGLIVSTTPGSEPSPALWSALAAGLVVAVTAGLVLQWLLSNAALHVLSGRAPTLRTALSTKNLGGYVVTSLLLGAIVAAGSLLCVLPGLAAAVAFVFAPLIALDKGTGPIDSLGRSYELVRSNLGQTLLTLLLAFAFLYAGSMICYIGMVATTPLSILMIAYSYRVLDHGHVAP